MLMQSWRDFIELFPYLPTGTAAAFGTLRAVGGFLVSAQRGEDGVVAEPVTLTSTVGGTAAVLPPWPGHALAVRRAGGGAVPTQAAGRLSKFETSAGETYELSRGASAG